MKISFTTKKIFIDEISPQNTEKNPEKVLLYFKKYGIINVI